MLNLSISFALPDDCDTNFITYLFFSFSLFYNFSLFLNYSRWFNFILFLRLSFSLFLRLKTLLELIDNANRKAHILVILVAEVSQGVNRGEVIFLKTCNISLHILRLFIKLSANLKDQVTWREVYHRFLVFTLIE